MCALQKQCGDTRVISMEAGGTHVDYSCCTAVCMDVCSCGADRLLTDVGGTMCVIFSLLSDTCLLPNRKPGGTRRSMSRAWTSTGSRWRGARGGFLGIA